MVATVVNIGADQLFGEDGLDVLCGDGPETIENAGGGNGLIGAARTGVSSMATRMPWLTWRLPPGPAAGGDGEDIPFRNAFRRILPIFAHFDRISPRESGLKQVCFRARFSPSALPHFRCRRSSARAVVPLGK